MGGERFSYRITKDGKVLVRWHGGRGKREIVLKGARADRLIAELPGMDYEQEQLTLARATGNFKRGLFRAPAAGLFAPGLSAKGDGPGASSQTGTRPETRGPRGVSLRTLGSGARAGSARQEAAPAIRASPFGR